MVSPNRVYAPWDMTSDNAIVNLHDPTNQQDAATKSYVDRSDFWFSLLGSDPDPTYGDACASGALDPRWALAGPSPAAVVASGGKYALTIDLAADRMMQAFADNGQDFELMVHIENQVNAAAMFGPLALTAAGNGVGLSPYGDLNTYLWAVAAYGYAGT